ncbi:MAG: CHAT domain-containing protein, partial [Bacteroidota bacterium]
FAIVKNKISAYKLTPLSMLEPEITGLISNIKKKEGLADRLWKLYQELLKPVLEELNEDKSINTITIIPDGILGYLPFELLLQNKPKKQDNLKSYAYLLKDYTTSYHQSLSLVEYNKRKEKRAALTRFVGFAPEFKKEGNPLLATRSAKDKEIAKGLEMLPGALQEVQQIAKIMQGEVKIGNDATESSFKALAKNAEILHLATHTIIDDENPLYSKLVFTTENNVEEDGLLYNYELFNMDFNAQLVSLSACNTGIGKYLKGEGIMSLANGFMYAGVPNVMMTAWAVPDISTVNVMQAFYMALKDGQSESEALRDAKLNYLKNADENLSHPYYWGAYMMIGNAKTSNTNRLFYWLAAFLLIAIITFSIIKKKKRIA